ncbi:hypothetical protein N9E69_03660 [Pelagibacteraceae bacterium]|nr:hypothetical protein [Pelagibacteraceae bacterium]
MNEESQKEIDWKKIARTFAFSLVWYISISAIWWIIGVGTEILFTLQAQVMIAGLASLISFLQNQK